MYKRQIYGNPKIDPKTGEELKRIIFRSVPVFEMCIRDSSNTVVDLAFVMDQVNKDQNKGFIVSHNHPSGGLRASKADIAVSYTHLPSSWGRMFNCWWL